MLYTARLDNGLRDFLRDVMGDTPQCSRIPSGSRTPRDLFDFGLNTEIDFSSFDTDFSLYTPASPDSITNPPMGVESLQRPSVWRYRPQPQDNFQNNLSLPARHNRFATPRRISEALKYDTRDQIFALVLSVTSHCTSFPSVDVLDGLLQYYLHITTLIHLPTFTPNKCRPELCAAMISAGTAMIPYKSVTKLGLALQETLRLGVPYKIEKDNSLIRDLQFLQTSFIALGIGLWSGNSRKMELAESFTLCWVTMMRRGGFFTRRYDDIQPCDGDNDEQVDAKWHEWIEAESKKRLVFSFYVHDAHQSITLFVNPVMSYAELCLPLPCPSVLWSARSSQEWKEACQSHSPAPSVIDLLQDMDKFVGGESFDRTVATGALLSAIWGLIRDYRQQSAVASTSLRWSHRALLLTSQQAEIKKLLDCIRMAGPHTANLKIYLEVASMHLYMSLEDIHVFAGIEGPEEARRVYPKLAEWIKTPDARQALCNAGQIVRQARKLQYIRGFEAVALYQAALAFWTYGVIFSAARLELARNGTRTQGTTFVLLDQAEEYSTQHYIALDRGEPALSAFENGYPAPLSQPHLIMATLIDVFKASHGECETRPWLVENLLDLMSSLQHAVTINGT